MASPAAPAEVRVDPVTFEVVRHRLHAITDEQAATLKAISGSKNVTEMSDYNVGLYLPDGSVATPKSFGPSRSRTIIPSSSICTCESIRGQVGKS